MATISAYAGDDLKREVDRIAREEGRSQAQVATSALELYTSLSAAARQTFLQLRAAGRVEAVLTELGRVLLSARWELLSEQVDREIEERGSLPEGELSEAEIARIAVEMTSTSGREQRRRASG
ncbi:hypothetical protein BH24GEM3_BH24GEM3_25980 [soil metagenome]|jgi:predicted transcriptional regulator|nr:hypothetical protein [Gemmatimonadota bacterium]MDQ3606625.1 hypothetical protein [Gemmatimonadota bacterium]